MTEWIKNISSNTKLCLILALAAISVYANTLQNGFAMDDYVVIKNNSIVTRGISAVPELLSTPYLRGNMISTNDHYKPLSLVIFAIEYQLTDGTPFLFHLINILIFAACVVLMFLFFNRLFEKKKTAAAFIACLLFALHPVQTEVVANIKSRDQLLCFFFAFSSLLVFMKFITSGNKMTLFAGFLLYFLSLLSKESSITFLAINPVVFLLFCNRNKQRSMSIISGSFIVAALFLLIRYSVLQHYNAGAVGGYTIIENSLAFAPSVSSKIATAVLDMGYYLRLLAIPYPLISDYSYHTIPFTNFTDFRVLLSLVVYIALAFIGTFRLLKKQKDPYAFAILFYLISMSVFSNIIILVAADVAERFLFFGGAAFCLIPALMIDRFFLAEYGEGLNFLKNKTALAILIPVCLIFSSLTIHRNTEWHDNYTLLKADVLKAPTNCRLQYSLGTNLIITAREMPQNEDAKKLVADGMNYLKKAIEIYPGFDLAWSELANTFYQQQQYDSAEIYSVKTLSLNPHEKVIMENLSAIYFKAGKYRESLDLCNIEAYYYPGYSRAYRNIGNCYLRLNIYDSAILAYKGAIYYEPSVTVSYERLAIAYKLSGNMDSAQKYLQIAQHNNPGFNY